jgi:predicted nucleic acid-binding protein
MNPNLSVLDEGADALVLDASALLNMLGTGITLDILNALAMPIVVEETTFAEGLRDPRNVTSTDNVISELVSTRMLVREVMDVRSLDIFLDLVGGDPPDDLSDGEAATIAHALFRNAAPVIDERKTTRIARTRFPQLTICSTLDILSSSCVTRALGIESLSAALFDATKYARMRIPHHFEDWVREVLGPERSKECRSLRKR